MLEFLDRYFFYIWLGVVLVILSKFAQLYLVRKRRGSVFPPSENENILYHENFASGRSLDGKKGWASNCLRITATEDELWIASFFPFSILLDQFDLEHRIRRNKISSITPSRSFLARGYILKFVDENGTRP